MSPSLLISIGGFTLALLSFVLSRIVTRRVHVKVHRAAFVEDSPFSATRLVLAASPEYYFVNITNVSLSREVEITHIWFDCTPKVYIVRPERPLPKRLKVDETWETWVAASEFSADLGDETIFNLARVRLSTGKIYHSQQNKSVPNFGTVPGGNPPRSSTGTP